MKGVVFQMGASAAAVGLAISAGAGSVEGFVSPLAPARGAHSTFVRHGVNNLRAALLLADCRLRSRRPASMSLKPRKTGGPTLLPRWARPRAVREGTGRGFPFLRRAAEDDGVDEEDEEYEDENVDYLDEDQGLDRCETCSLLFVACPFSLREAARAALLAFGPWGAFVASALWTDFASIGGTLSFSRARFPMNH